MPVPALIIKGSHGTTYIADKAPSLQPKFPGMIGDNYRALPQNRNAVEI